MSEVFRPSDAAQLVEVVAWATAEAVPLELKGAGTKAALGRPTQASYVLDLSGLTGVALYEPEELVLKALAGTPLSEVEELVRRNNQQLAFEPADLGPLLGHAAGGGTIGGALACNLSGPRRIKAGAARDHFLGVAAVSGRGEVFKSGGRVVKNVTGYDLCKVLAGSYGTLGAMSEVTVKVLPAPDKVRTVLIAGLDDETAVTLMGEASRTAHEVSGFAHLPATVAARSEVEFVAGAAGAVTALRIEGPGASVEHRCAALREHFGGRGEIEELHSHNSARLWREVRDVLPLAGEQQKIVWRLSLPPAAGARVRAAIDRVAATEAYYDWAGGLIWLAMEPADDAHAALVRGAIAECGGHATLVRAPAAVRAAVPVFQPQEAPLARLSAALKESFDPRRVLNPGRMYADV